MKDNFLISIITPFYYGNKYMKQLFSVVGNNQNTLKKSFPNAAIELVIVNDSPAVCVDLSGIKCDFEYRIITHENNSGIHQARVTGLRNCNGDYILFLDQDDELSENAVASQVKKLITTNADMVICNAYMQKKDGGSYLLYKTKTDYATLYDLNFYLKSHNVIKSPGQCLIKKICIPIEWTEHIMVQNGSDDLFLWILMLEQSYEVVVNNKPLYIHKYTGENLSESEEKMNVSSLEIVDYLKKVPYVPEKHVALLKRSRDFSLQLRNKSVLRKCCLVLRNVDLVLYLILNKLKRLIY